MIVRLGISNVNKIHALLGVFVAQDLLPKKDTAANLLKYLHKTQCIPVRFYAFACPIIASKKNAAIIRTYIKAKTIKAIYIFDGFKIIAGIKRST